MLKLTVPEGVEKIGTNAFCGCYNLCQVSLPDSLQEVGSLAFSGAGLGSDLDIPESVWLIARDAFRATEWLEQKKASEPFVIINGILISAGTARTGEVVIPDGVEKIGLYAFCQCEEITSVVIPDSVTGIGEGAFAGCTQLGDITVPEGLLDIGAGAFDGTLWQDSHLDTDMFVILNDVLMHGGTEAAGEITIPAGVREIADDAFRNCAELLKVLIPDTVTKIGDSAFENTGLTEVVIPANVSEIGMDAFARCGNLRTVTLPDDLKTIGTNAFYGCFNLENIIVPSGVTEIADNAFASCGKLTLCGEAGSCAESYAKEHRIPFQALDVNLTGDVNCSGAVITEWGLANADCNQNGQRDDADLTMILQYIAKKITF